MFKKSRQQNVNLHYLVARMLVDELFRMQRSLTDCIYTSFDLISLKKM